MASTSHLFFTLFLITLACSAELQPWTDWDKLQSCTPSFFSNVFTREEELVLFLKGSSSWDQVKVVGAGHSFSSITLTDDGEGQTAMLNLDSYTGIVSVEEGDQDGVKHVEVKAGTRLRDLNTLLEARYERMLLRNTHTHTPPHVH